MILIYIQRMTLYLAYTNHIVNSNLLLDAKDVPWSVTHALHTTPKSKRLMAYHCNLDTINVVEHRSQGFHLRSMLLHLLHDCNVLKCLEGFEGWQCLNQNKCGRTTHMQHLRRDRCFMTSPSKMSRLVFWNSLQRYQNRKNIDPTATAAWPYQPWHFR